MAVTPSARAIAAGQVAEAASEQAATRSLGGIHYVSSMLS